MAKKPTRSKPGSAERTRTKAGSPAEISQELLIDLVTSLIGVKGAEVTVSIDLPKTEEELTDLQTFIVDSKARAKVDLTIDLYQQKERKAHFTALVTTFLEKHDEESVKVAVCASCGFMSPGPVEDVEPASDPSTPDDQDKPDPAAKKRKKA